MTTPRYEYSRGQISKRVSELSSLEAPYGLTVRYAVKANPHQEIIKMVHAGGLHFDASSSYEAESLLTQGIPGSHISLSSQQSPHNLEQLLAAGVQFVATSLKQLGLFGDAANHPDQVSVRLNHDLRHGHNQRTSTGGVSASFGIWHEYIPQILDLAVKNNFKITRLHTHVGSGADPDVWKEVIDRSHELVKQLPDVTTLDLGGGYKVHRYGNEAETDITAVMQTFSQQLELFAKETNRKLHLEIEPGTFLIAHAGTLVATVDDIVDTGKAGFTFLRLNTGMNDFLRSTMYGAQHKIEVTNNATTQKEYVVVGHNCESGDIFTPANGNPEKIEPRLLNEARIGDEVRIYDAGAYCASMRAQGYNSFPEATEIFVD